MTLCFQIKSYYPLLSYIYLFFFMFKINLKIFYWILGCASVFCLSAFFRMHTMIKRSAADTHLFAWLYTEYIFVFSVNPTIEVKPNISGVKGSRELLVCSNTVLSNSVLLLVLRQKIFVPSHLSPWPAAAQPSSHCAVLNFNI